jgi:alpha-mannosidase
MPEYPDHLTTRRARTLLDQVVRPSVYSDHLSLKVEVFQSDEPVAYGHAIAATYRPVELGFTWGPVWSTAWFRLTGAVPASWDDSFRVLFDTRTEALCWWDGAPYQGVELHRQDVKLPASVTPGQPLTLHVEAACNHMLGVGNQYGGVDRLGEFPVTQSGQLKLAHLARHHPRREAMGHDLDLLCQLVQQLPEASARRRVTADALRRACNALEARDLDACVPAVRAICGEALNTPTQGGANRVHCVGHAHIDLAWLWPIRETRRKAARSFSTVLRYMERHPDYRFIQSQPQLYEWVREDYPALFAEIRQRAAEGRWEAAGAMWVEADCNIPSGESLVRQVLLGCLYFEQHFGREQTYLWLPDVFGYSAALPQILKRSGLRAFFTQKISWNQFNQFPHHSFNWVGHDGTAIPSHFFPSDTYNASNRPDEMIRGDQQYQQSAPLPGWLQAYGYGDGGGGPTETMIAFVDRMGDCAGLPRLEHASVQSYADRLIDAADRLPTWDGELYLERHRGTYTSHATFKRSNRLGELAFKRLELLQVLVGADPQERRRTDRLWKDFLLNQFHDIIPGSSIEWVNREARALYAEVDRGVRALTDTAVHRLLDGAGMPPPGAASRWLVVNTRSRGAGGLVEVAGAVAGSGAAVQPTTDADGEAVSLIAVPDGEGPGVRIHRGLPAPTASGLTVDPDRRRMENRDLSVELDAAGRVQRLIYKPTGRSMLPPGEVANQLVLYDDRPMAQEGWAVDVFYLEKGAPIEDDVEINRVENGPWRVALEFERPLGRDSRLRQRVELTHDQDWVTFNTVVDWREERTILRVLHPIDVRSDHATFEVQHGHVRRPNHFNTSWDVARFESPAQRWTDLSEPGFGVTLLNDCKYGHSAHGRVLGMSLLRGPREPDETADRGRHRFRYALRPHGGFEAADATRAAEAFNEPLLAYPVGPGACSSTPQLPFTLRGPHASAVAIDAIKPAESGGGSILRLRETRGGRGSVTLEAAKTGPLTETNLLEKPIGPTRSASLSIDLKPFEVRTFRLGP